MNWQIGLILIVFIVLLLIIGSIYFSRDDWQCPKCGKIFVGKGEKTVSRRRGTWNAVKIVKIERECPRCAHRWQTKEEIDQTVNT